ncbi:complex I intermediate-associated CIA30 domain containing protein [Nitzschia inconspicua]|uniref:Complex I intermediate-associated CIA30 domain containing protein n=1 Tax=Nitzschia inconspicua TaxID=303405 RepID=A0A9K3LA89_9STRA|nr:complex I intermediate-associated CIA30 domain containing protein [Nitzschia inconspicua]
MNRKRWFELDVEKNGPLSLWDFRFPEDAQTITGSEGTWRLLDDSVIGGYSHANVQLIRSPQEYQRVVWGKNMPMDEKNGLQISDATDTVTLGTTSVDAVNGKIYDASEELNEENKPSFVPFVRWQGTLDTRVNKEQQKQHNVMRSGFCSMISPEFPLLDLGGRYNGIEIMCRSDGRPYSLNLKVESYIPDDLYQCLINVPPTKPSSDQSNEDSFDRVVLLFQHFIVTAGGRMRTTQRELDNRIRIQSIGLTLMDGVNGPFCFDLARIRAVNYDETGVIGEAD